MPAERFPRVCRRATSRSFVDALETRLLFISSHFIPAANAASTIFDSVRNRLYVVAGTSVERFDLTKHKVLTPWTNVGSALEGGDITPDGKSLYLSDFASSGQQALVHKLDINTGTIKNLRYRLSFDDWSKDVVITSDNHVIVGHSGQSGLIHVIDTTTDQFVPDLQHDINGGFLYRGANRSNVISSDGNQYSSERYDAVSHGWSDDYAVDLGRVVVSPDGSLIASSSGYFDRHLQLLRTRKRANDTGTGSTPLGFDPTGKLLYSFDSSGDSYGGSGIDGKIVVRDVSNDAVKYFFSVEKVINMVTPLGSVSDDGKWLAVLSDGGVRVIDLDTAVPSGSISGTVFVDSNNNQRKRGSTEVGLSGVRVYIDANGNQKLDADERSTKTNGAGRYSFTGLQGETTYAIRQIVPTGYTQSTQEYYADTLYVDLGNGESVSRKDLGNLAFGSINGYVYHDTNTNGAFDTNETAIAGARIYIDENQNNAFDKGEPSVKTNSAGRYRLDGLPAGRTYRVGEVIPDGYAPYLPASEFYVVSLASGEIAMRKSFANVSGGYISGNVFNDVNGNQQRDEGELGLGLWYVYIDANNNGKRDHGETSATTDVNGNWRLGPMKSGTYTVRVKSRNSVTFTTASGVMQLTLMPGQSRKNRVFGIRAIA